MRNLVRLALLLILFGTALPAPNFVVVIDAGSSGSRVHLFGYESPEEPGGVPDIKEYLNKKSPIPLAQKPEDALAAIAKTLLYYTAILEEHGREPRDVPVYLNATAGMRLLPQAHQRAIYEKAVAALSETGYEIRETRTISGEEEGLYDWLAIYYLMTDEFAPGQVGGGHGRMLTLDLGGASVQLTTPDDTCQLEGESVFDIRGNRYCVKPTSYLGLGLNEAESHSASKACYLNGVEFPDGGEAHFNYHDCQKGIDKYLDSKSIMPVQVWATDGLEAVAAAYHTVNFFGAYFNDPNSEYKYTRMDELTRVVKQKCSEGSWQDWQRLYPNEKPEYLKSYCFAGVYLDRLLSSKHGFSIQRDFTFGILDKVNGMDASWALGVALYHSYFEP